LPVCKHFKKHYAKGLCKYCWKIDWYTKNQEKRLKQERNRRPTLSKQKLKEKQIKDYKIVKNDPYKIALQTYRKYAYLHKKEFSRLKDNKCEVCGIVENLVIHHKKYTKEFKDWMLVCFDCHNKIHRTYNK